MTKRIANIVYYILFAAALLLIILRWYLVSINQHDTAEVVMYVTTALLLGAVFFRLSDKLFPRWFNNKPGKEE